ncbi:unnamed protein product [Symbiodinium microadriaticum]|nr:unnamed protein product [Symbiodinium microadriaticum]
MVLRELHEHVCVGLMFSSPAQLMTHFLDVCYNVAKTDLDIENLKGSAEDEDVFVGPVPCAPTLQERFVDTLPDGKPVLQTGELVFNLTRNSEAPLSEEDMFAFSRGQTTANQRLRAYLHGCTAALRELGLQASLLESGFLLALPTGSVPPTLLAAGAEADATGMHGPSTTLEVAAVEEDEDGGERPVSDSLSVLLVDLSDDALQYLAPYDSEAGLAVVSFDLVHPDRFPGAEDLLVLARSWLRAAAHDRAALYTAAEEEREPQGAPQVESPLWRPAGLKPPKPKRVTHAPQAPVPVLQQPCARRMHPPPGPAPFRFTEYVERYGGYQQQRELGLIQYMLCQITDLLLSGEVEGTLDLLSLMHVALEQAAQDHGKWEVAYVLSLFPDPELSGQVFQNCSSSQNPRLKAWAPLCPAPWATPALAYLKEADAIMARRSEAVGAAQPRKPADQEERKRLPIPLPRRPPLLSFLGLRTELTYSGLASDGYGPAFPGATLSAEQRGAALAPYRSLDADRLKLSGRANWDPSPFLHDALYLAFREPDSLLRSSIPEPSRAEVPASSAHDVEQLCKVAKIWDANDLLFLSSEGPSAERPYEAVRLFNCLKNTTTDRQIADRRGRNHVESIVPGPSREIPAGPSLQCLFAEPSLFGFGRPTEKIGITNSRFLLGGMLLQGSLPRGRGSLLTPETQLCGSKPPSLGGEDSLIDGLVIDDYYAISVHPDGDTAPSRAEVAFGTAKSAGAGILGSDDKVFATDSSEEKGAVVRADLSRGPGPEKGKDLRLFAGASHCSASVPQPRPSRVVPGTVFLWEEVTPCCKERLLVAPPCLHCWMRLASAFDCVIAARLRALETHLLYTEGLESPLVNQFASGLPWKVAKAWRWPRPVHINLLETACLYRLLCYLARRGVLAKRFCPLCDSNVAKCSVSKGRSPSRALSRGLKRIAAVATAFGLAMQVPFCPARLMPADHPSRDAPIPEPIPGFLGPSWTLAEVRSLASLPKLRRWASNGLRLFLLVSRYKPPLLSQHRCAGLSFRAFVPPCLDFDATLGYPGEGPLVWFWVLVFLSFRAKGVSVGESHGLFPRNAADFARQERRGRAALPQGRGVERKTEDRRATLWAAFLAWLKTAGVDSELFTQTAGLVDIDSINAVLSKYGRELYANGRPYSHFSETINAFAARTPKCRRLLQPAWDTAFGWRRAEPIQHHAAMPWQILCSCVVLAFLWGWPLVAGALALCWGGLLRPGELISALRSDLVLPGDIECSIPFAWFSIREPKTRYTAARHQSVKIDHPDILNVISIAYAPLCVGSKLWPSSGQTLRTRLRQLLEALKVPAAPTPGVRHLELASLRAGGASWMMLACEDPGLVQRRLDTGFVELLKNTTALFSRCMHEHDVGKVGGYAAEDVSVVFYVYGKSYHGSGAENGYSCRANAGEPSGRVLESLEGNTLMEYPYV